MTATIPKPKTRRLLKRSTTCLLILGVSLSTTAIAVAQFVPDSGLQDIINGSTGTSTGLQDIINGSTGNSTNPTFPDPDLQDIINGSTGTPTEPAENQSSSLEDYWRQAEEFYRNITRKNVSGILGQLEEILGQLGIPSPREYPGKIGEILKDPEGGTKPGSIPTGTPITPERIYGQQQIVTDTANSNQVWIYTDSVLGSGDSEGQNQIAQMKQTSAASSMAATNSASISANRTEQAAKNAELAQIASTNVEKINQQAQGRTATQDVVKDQAAQASELAKSNAAMSRQLSTLSEQQAHAANQVSALSNQSRVANEHLGELRVGQAYSNIQLHDIFNAQRHANNLEVIREQKNAQLLLGSTNAIYLPGYLAP